MGYWKGHGSVQSWFRVNSETCQARLAQSVERQALNLVVGGSSPPVGDSFCLHLYWLSFLTPPLSRTRDLSECSHISLPARDASDRLASVPILLHTCSPPTKKNGPWHWSSRTTGSSDWSVFAKDYSNSSLSNKVDSLWNRIAIKEMSIYYKSKTEKTFKKIDIPESFINVLELKKRLIEKDKIDMKRDFRFTLTDESGANGRLWRESKWCL